MSTSTSDRSLPPSSTEAAAQKRKLEDQFINRLLDCDRLVGWNRIFCYTVLKTKKRSLKQIQKLKAIALSIGVEVADV